MRLGTPRAGLVWRVGPLRIYIPFTGTRTRTRRVQVFTHEGCPVQHRTLHAAQTCEVGP